MKSFTESANPSPNRLVLNHHQQYIEAQSNLPISAENMADGTKPSDNADDGSDSAKLKQTPPFPETPSKEEQEENEMLNPAVASGEQIEKLRVCTVNKSPWDVPSLVRELLTKPTSDDSEHSMIPNLPSYTCRKANAMAEAIQQAHVDDDGGFKKTENENARLAYNRKEEMKTSTMPCGKEVLEAAEEEQGLESALVRVFSGEVAGLTVREAGCKLMLRNVNNVILEGLPLSVQVRRAMINSPYFVQMANGKFALWDDFLNTMVRRLDEEEITGSEKEKKMGVHKFDRDEDCASYNEPAKESGQLAKTNLGLAVPKITRTKQKRTRRVSLDFVMNMIQSEEKEDIGSCKQADGKRQKSCGKAVEQRSYNSVCGILSQCYCHNISDGNGKTHQNGLALPDERDEAASCLISFIEGDIEKNKRPPPRDRKMKPVKLRSLKDLYDLSCEVEISEGSL